MPSLQCPGHAARGRLHHPTSETGTAVRCGNTRSRPVRGRAKEAEYTMGAQRNAKAGNSRKKLAVKRTVPARSMPQLGQFDRHMVCAWEYNAIDMSNMLAATTVRS